MKEWGWKQGGSAIRIPFSLQAGETLGGDDTPVWISAQLVRVSFRVVAEILFSSVLRNANSPSQISYTWSTGGPESHSPSRHCKSSSYLWSLSAPLAEGPLLPTPLGVDVVLTAFLPLICSSAKVLNCCSGGRFRNSSLLCSLLFAFSKQSTALVHEICALIRCFIHFPDSWLVYVGSQRATSTRNLIKAVRMLTFSAFLMLRKQSSQ